MASNGHRLLRWAGRCRHPVAHRQAVMDKKGHFWIVCLACGGCARSPGLVEFQQHVVQQDPLPPR